MEHLPVELLQSIFMMLSPCSDLPAVIQVCKHWRNVGLEVMNLRKSIIISAYRLESSLRWQCHKLSIPAPTKRFGATILHRDQYVYVFGGATNMFTTFNDLWRFNLDKRTWKRLVVEGELPTPRAHAKGGFVGDILYLFGGCHSFHVPGMHHAGRVEWLSDLSSFNINSFCWSKHPLRHVEGLIMEPPIPVTAGQTGCFLPAGEVGCPGVFVLFGGISQSMTECGSDVCLVNPDRGEWMSLIAPPQSVNDPAIVAWPPGRCGHSVCALDSTRMLVLFGNLQPPISQPAFDESPPPRRQRLPSEADGELKDPPYHGQPAGDIWILTRTRIGPHSTDWSSVHWYWTKVDCPCSVSGCPPLDFYYACTVCLPWSHDIWSTKPGRYRSTRSCIEQTHEEQSQSPSPSKGVRTFTVVCISQPTRILLEEAAKQRRYWWHRARSGSNSRVRSVPRSASLLASTGDTSPNVENPGAGVIEGSCDPVTTMSNPPGIPPSPTASQLPDPGKDQANDAARSRTAISLPPSPQNPSCLLQGSRRSAERRARQLEALAVQERRLFGSRSSTSQAASGSPSHSTSPNPHSPGSLTQPSELCNLLQSGTMRPLVTYTLSLQISADRENLSDSTKQNAFSMDSTQPVVGQWLAPKKSHFLDLVFGPSECLGFSCTFGHGCIFLFGGLCDSDEVSPDRRSVSPDSTELRPPIESARPIAHSRQPESSVLRSGDLELTRTQATRTSQFYVLQARSLVGTLL
ncbi:hypothetical protein D915_003484 [Fasciola hepatica]|uniref:F-box domain-containing protein n=1 Tax=Fasciola hepatica TaxID=6192 RepID=A0A4E0RDL9_FASHE|nr:hypothetical protein D915_003484 [Fasciola hepatica]